MDGRADTYTDDQLGGSVGRWLGWKPGKGRCRYVGRREGR